MNILLLKKIKKLGDVGQEVSVKAGYARNFLFPKEFALPMTKENIEIIEQKKQEFTLAQCEQLSDKNMWSKNHTNEYYDIQVDCFPVDCQGKDKCE